MPVFDAETIVGILLGAVFSLGIYIYKKEHGGLRDEIEDHKKKFKDHDSRLKSLELMGRDVQYIKEGVDELKGRVQK